MTDHGFPPPPGIVLPPPEWAFPIPTATEHDGVRSIRAVPFVSQPGYRAVYLDLHLPRDPGHPVPLVVFIHGGAFIFGTREILAPMYLGRHPDPFTAIAQGGIAVASIDYRLSSEAIFPAQVHDVAAAVRYLVQRSAELGLDASRIAVWGESAGAHLAQLLVFGYDDPDRIGRTGAPVEIPPPAALVSWYGLSDVRVPLATLPFPGPSPEERLLGGPPAGLPEAAAAASPILQVRATVPTALVMHGTADATIPIAQSTGLAERLVEAGVDVETSWIEGADHAWNGSPEAAEEALATTIDFLGRVLSPR
jgi:acetyl esterase/lipase